MKTYNWLNKTEYPFQSHYLQLADNQLHYIDEGKGETLVFVHGTPTWSFLYRDIIKELRQNYRCIALDHLGFGLSDKPQNYPYHINQHTENLAKLITHLKLANFTLVAHDFGGVIGLNYAVKNPEKINKLVLFNTFAWSDEGEVDFEKFKKILKSPILPFLYKYFNFSARFVLPQGFGNQRNLTKMIHQQYLKPFFKINERQGTLGFVKSLLNEQKLLAQIWENQAKISDKPLLLLWGMKDKFLTDRYLQKFINHFPHHQIQQFAEAGHFVPEEVKGLGKIVQEFLKAEKIVNVEIN